MSMYGEGSSIVKVGIFDVVYPLPGLTTVILVTIPALLIWALNNASLPVPSGNVTPIETLGEEIYPWPAVLIATEAIVPATETTGVAIALVGIWYPLPTPTVNSPIIPPLGRSPFAADPVNVTVTPVPTI